MIRKRFALFTAAFTFTALLLVPLGSAYALESATAEGMSEGARLTQMDNFRLRIHEQTEKVKAHLEGEKLRTCKGRSLKINGLMKTSVVRIQMQEKIFTGAATHVEAFYVKKGKTLATYDTLVTNVNLAKAKVDTDVVKLQSYNKFSCDSTNPKATVEAYKTDLKTASTDLKSLKTAVKNLIVGVKSVQSTTKQGGEQ